MSILEQIRPEWATDGQPFIRLSHSTLETVQTCERKFQLEKLLQGPPPREESEHFSFGHAFGTFAAMYLLTGGAYEYCLFEGWLAYWPIVETEKKNQELFLEVAERSRPVLDRLLEDWEVAIFDGEPALELSLRIDIDDVFYYVGYVDVVLRHKVTGVYGVLDFKTTGLTIEDLAPLYKHSGQALGYSIVLDDVAGEQNSNEVLYFVGRIGRSKFESTRAELYPFAKSLADRLRWFTSLLQDIEFLRRCIELDNFPRRVSGCLSFNRPCKFFGSCHLTSADAYKKFVQDEADQRGYQFHYQIKDLIANHTQRLEAM